MAEYQRDKLCVAVAYTAVAYRAVAYKEVAYRQCR